MGEPFHIDSFAEIFLTEKDNARTNSDRLRLVSDIYAFGSEAERINRFREMKQLPMQNRASPFRWNSFTHVDEGFQLECAELPVDLLTEEGLTNRCAREIDYLLGRHISIAATNESHAHPFRARIPSK